MTHEYYELHELAELYHEMKEREYTNLKLNIKRRGLINPIQVWAEDPEDDSTWKVIDGRHRQRACQELGIECDYFLNEFSDYEEALQFVKSANHNRRGSIFEVVGNKEKRAMIKAELLKNPDRSDRSIGKLLQAGRDLVAKVRKEIGAESNKRQAADGRTFGATSENEKNDIAPETPTSAPESTIQAKNALQSDANPVEVKSFDLQHASANMIDALFDGSSDATKGRYRPWIEAMLKSEIGSEIYDRYDGWEAGKGFTKFCGHKAGTHKLVDLRIGWPNLGMAFAEQMACKPNERKKLQKLMRRVDDLDKINAANEGKEDYQRGQHSLKFWHDMSKLDKPKTDNVTNISDHKPAEKPVISFHGERIQWEDIEGMDYKRAHCVAMMVDTLYHEHFTMMMTYRGEIPDCEIGNFARTLRHLGDSVEAIAGQDARRVLSAIASALDKNPGVRQGRSEVYQTKYHTNQ